MSDITLPIREKDAYKRLGIGRSTWFAWKKAGKIPSEALFDLNGITFVDLQVLFSRGGCDQRKEQGQ